MHVLTSYLENGEHEESEIKIYDCLNILRYPVSVCVFFLLPNLLSDSLFFISLLYFIICFRSCTHLNHSLHDPWMVCHAVGDFLSKQLQQTSPTIEHKSDVLELCGLFNSLSFYHELFVKNIFNMFLAPHFDCVEFIQSCRRTDIEALLRLFCYHMKEMQNTQTQVFLQNLVDYIESHVQEYSKGDRYVVYIYLCVSIGLLSFCVRTCFTYFSFPCMGTFMFIYYA